MIDQLSSLLDSRASTVQRSVALGLAVFVGMLSLMLAPFSSLPVERNPAFLPGFYTALLFAKGLTSYLLFLHYFAVRRLSMGVLASVYLLVSCLAGVGLFHVNDRVLDLRQFWILWRSLSDPGIILAVWSYSRWSGQRMSTRQMQQSLWPLLLLPPVIAGVFVHNMLHGHSLLLVLLNAPAVLPGVDTAGALAFIGSILTLMAVIFLTRLRSVLHLWLAFVVFIGSVNACFVLFFQLGETSMGWYVANMATLMSSIVLMFVLLQELHHIYQHIQFANTQLWVKSMHDGLTGVFNRRYLDEQLALELQRMRRNTLPLSLILIDVDHFKQINDVYGHTEGDACLVHVARLLRSLTRRPADFLARYGGEEFVIVLPETSLLGAASLAEAARQLIESTPTPAGQTVRISAGVASCQWPTEDQSGAELLRHADSALYAAKKMGRNQVQVHEPRIP